MYSKHSSDKRGFAPCESSEFTDKEFDAYADEVLKKAHPDDFDEEVAKKVKDGLKKKYGDDYGAAVGALTSGFGK